MPPFADLDARGPQKVRSLAAREHRSAPGFAANAVVVFSDLQKDIRDSPLELRTVENAAAFAALTREMPAAVAR